MNVDERIGIIMSKMGQLSDKKRKFPCGEFPPKWKPPLQEEIVERYERENGVILPEDYRRFITTVASGGTQPFYGLYSLVEKLPKYVPRAVVGEKFLYTVRTPLNIEGLSDEEYEIIFETEEVNIDAGYVLLCNEGCGMYSILIVNTDDKDTYGTVWFSCEVGIYPLIHQVTKKTMGFLDWLEYYVDKTLELDDEDCFSYGELAGIVF